MTSTCLPCPADAVDCWALGVLIFHLLTGSSPFAAPGDDELRIYKRIVKGFVAYPPHVSGVAKDVMGQLLCRDPTQRLGAVSGRLSHWLCWREDVHVQSVLRLGCTAGGSGKVITTQ